MNGDFLEQKWIESTNGKLCYFIGRGFSSRPSVIFLHGLSSNHTTWKFTTQELEKLKFNVLLPDLRGHGYSDKTKKRSLYKIPVFTEDLKKIIEKENLSQIVLVGYSFGGFIALDYAIKYPSDIAGLFLISTNHVNPLKYKHLNFLTWPAYGAVNLLAWLLIWQKRKKYYYFDQDDSHGYWDSTFKGYTTMPLAVNFWLLTETANVDFSQNLKKISCPTFLLKSHSDPFVSQEEIDDMKSQIKLARAVVLNEPSHFLATRHQSKILKILIDFLKKNKLI